MSSFGWTIFIIVIICLELYSYYSFRSLIKNVREPYRQIYLVLYLFISIGWLLLGINIRALRNSHLPPHWLMYIFTFVVAVTITKLLIASLLLVDDVRSLLSFAFKKVVSPATDMVHISRSTFLQQTAWVAGGSLLGIFAYGMVNRYRYRVQNIPLTLKRLPPAFRGLKVVQISDIHSGSFTNRNAVAAGVKRISELKPDIIFFTGDLVNVKAEEMEPYVSVFKELNAPMGVFSIFGNHDYGDYHEWDHPGEKENNINYLKQIHKALGWDLLLDENRILEKNGQKVAIIGVENISARFTSYGNLSKAYNGLEESMFKILLSHDPSHWDMEVNKQYRDIDLTLSGHTHGLQFGINIPWLKWSPAKYLYRQWAGLYQKGNQYLYVNTGYGFLGYPGRVGFLPEITCFELT